MTTTKVYVIDKECKHQNGLVVESDRQIYSCTLNQTNIDANNNKYYLMQLIKLSDNSYVLFIRYGRIGETRSVFYKDFTDINDGIRAFERQFKTKTGNKFGTKQFEKKDGLYHFADVCNEVEVELKVAMPVVKVSKLTERVQKLMSLLCDKEIMQKSLIQLELDVKKMPLGKINEGQLKDAELILSNIKTHIQINNYDKDELKKMCNAFYTKIPYACGRRRPPVIENQELLDKFIDMIDELRNIVVTTKIMEATQDNAGQSQLDIVYDGLNTVIEPLEKDSVMWNHIETYIKNTHGKTHHFKVELQDIFKIERQNEKNTYDKKFGTLNNKQLLWHGSSITNFCSIFKNGLLLDPSRLGVAITGKMFGYGIYTANAFSKSFNYCNSHVSNNIAALLLCEVALGTCLEKIHSDSYLSDKSMRIHNTNSTHGKGQWVPSDHVIVDDVKIPNGKLVQQNPSNQLYYDEFIVYDKDQLNIKYMVIVKQN